MTDSNLPLVGEFYGGALVLAVHGHGYGTRTSGVVLGYLENAAKDVGRYVVWTMDRDGTLRDQRREFYSTEALRAYVERVAARLYAHHNEMAPALTYLETNPESGRG